MQASSQRNAQALGASRLYCDPSWLMIVPSTVYRPAVRNVGANIVVEILRMFQNNTEDDLIGEDGRVSHWIKKKLMSKGL